jgi:thioesterase domain-containing protein
MSGDSLADADKRSAEALVARIHEQIPLTQAMQLAVEYFDGQELVLRVPLGPNVNDKGTAFAGSITSLGSIAGWCLLTLWAEREIGPCQVAIFDAHFAFKKPLRGDFTASVKLPSPEDCKALKYAVTKRGRGRAVLKIALADADGVATTLNAAYAVWLPAPASGD